MTAPDGSTTPSVSTAPAEGASSSTASPAVPLRRRRLPAHLGHARMSTVVLAVAFVAIGVLYLFVKPAEPSDAAGTGSVGTSRSSQPTEEAPAPSTTPPADPTTSEGPSPTETTSPEAGTSAEETSDAPAETTEATEPAQTEAPPSEPSPTTTAPPS